MIQVKVDKVKGDYLALRSYNVEMAIMRNENIQAHTPKGVFEFTPDTLANSALGKSNPIKSKYNNSHYSLIDYKIPKEERTMVKYVCIQGYPGVKKGTVIYEVEKPRYKMINNDLKDLEIEHIDHYESFWERADNIVVRTSNGQYEIYGEDVTIVEL